MSGSHHYTYPRLYKNNSNSRKQDGLLGGRAGQDDQGVTTVQDGQLEHVERDIDEERFQQTCSRQEYKDKEAVRLRALFRIILRLVDIIYLETLVWIERSLKLVITLRDERILKLVTMINVQGRNEISMRWTKRP